MIVRIAAVVLALLLVINLILFALGKVTDMLFWAIIIIAAIAAYYILPRLKKHKK